jgi:lipoprotein-anchoring transpeptidase ErfK/SrfK
VTNPCSRGGTRRVWAAAAALAAAGLLAGCTTGSDPGGSTTTVVKTVAPSTPGSTAPAQPTSQPPTEPALPKKQVKVTSLENDGVTYGIGMPIVLYFSPVPTDSSAFLKAVSVTVNGKPANGAWYWEQPDADEVAHHVIEAHYRPHGFPGGYWPAHSQIHVSLPIGGLSAGSTKTNELVYWNKLTSLDYSIGAANISTVDANNGEMTVTSDGKVVKKFKAGLGASQTPTYKGIKVVMQKGEDVPGTNKLRPDGTVRMIGTGSDHYDLMVKWSVRITQSGEYVHAAPWNPHQTATSNGCTNLSTANAKWFYGFSQIGDVVKYPNAPGPQMRPDDGFGDWNVPWSVWQAGGALPTR